MGNSIESQMGAAVMDLQNRLGLLGNELAACLTNKSANMRARKATNELAKVGKEFRALSVAYDKRK